MSYPSGLNSLFVQPPRRRCFISYHHEDTGEVQRFVDAFGEAWEIFSSSALGLDLSSDIVDSTDTDYVVRAIRERYMSNTSVTLVMLGRCTWSRRYIDWEIQASLRSSAGSPANGLLAVKLPSFSYGPGQFPERLNANLLPAAGLAVPGQDCYARWIDYPATAESLRQAIEEAFQRRQTHGHLINNSRDRFAYNRQCQ